MSTGQMEVRGHSSFDASAPIELRLLAGATDLFWMALILAASIHWGEVAPIPSLFRVLIFIFIVFFFWILQQYLTGATLGQWIWRLRLLDENHNSPARTKNIGRFLIAYFKGFLPHKKSPFLGIYQREKLASPAWATNLGLTLVSAMLSFFLVNHFVFQNPIWSHHPVWKLSTFAPPEGSAEEKDWVTLPFFYTLGAWPKRFLNTPILFTLPYQKGPPKRFTGAIIARWKMPEIQLRIEGPRTPTEFDHPEKIKKCFSGEVGLSFLECLEIKNQTLYRHLKELQHEGLQAQKISWFQVDDPAFPETELAKGIYIYGQNKTQAQEHFVLINQRGSHQSIVLKRSRDRDGDLAHDLLVQTIGSLRLVSDLKPGRALVNQRLSKTRLADVRKISDSIEVVSHLSGILALLVAKISVDPKNHEAYYHLGGTSLMLAQHAAQVRLRKTAILKGKILLLLSEWLAAAKPMVRSAFLYAKDVAPTHPNTKRLEDLWIESQKF